MLIACTCYIKSTIVVNESFSHPAMYLAQYSTTQNPVRPLVMETACGQAAVVAMEQQACGGQWYSRISHGPPRLSNQGDTIMFGHCCAGVGTCTVIIVTCPDPHLVSKKTIPLHSITIARQQTPTASSFWQGPPMIFSQSARANSKLEIRNKLRKSGKLSVSKFCAVFCSVQLFSELNN